MQNSYRRFEADCDQVNVPDGTLLDVWVNGKKVGSFASLPGRCASSTVQVNFLVNVNVYLA